MRIVPRRSIPLIAMTLLLARSTPALGQANDTTQSATVTPAQIAQWHGEIDRAEADKSSGRRLQFGGGALVVGGLLLDGASIAHAGSHSTIGLFVGGLAAVGAGAIVGSAGERRAHEANVTLHWLNDHGPAPLAPNAWRTEMAAVHRRVAAGRKTKIAGFAILGGGLLVNALSSRCLERSGCGGTLVVGELTIISGAIVAGAGNRAMHDAALRGRLLEAHPPAGSVALARPGADHVLMNVQAGAGSVLWRLSW